MQPPRRAAPVPSEPCRKHNRLSFGATPMRTFVPALTVMLLGMACGSSSPGSDDGPLTLRLGYFPNLTHAPALVGLQNGLLAHQLGDGVSIEQHTFNAGGDAVTAILSGSLDVGFVGPNPTVNAFVQSHGQAIRVVSGATSGGALLVVRPDITSPSQLRGKKIADPQLGGTQDVALRWYLKSQGFKTDTLGGGDVSVVPQDNSLTLNAFKARQIDGAWLPEPWASRLVLEGGGRVLADERDLWPDGKFVTTDLIVATQFPRHPLAAEPRAPATGKGAAPGRPPRAATTRPRRSRTAPRLRRSSSRRASRPCRRRCSTTR